MKICSFPQMVQIKHTIKLINKPPKYYNMLVKRKIRPYKQGYFWREDDNFHREERFQQLLEHFKKPENRYLQV